MFNPPLRVMMQSFRIKRSLKCYLVWPRGFAKVDSKGKTLKGYFVLSFILYGATRSRFLGRDAYVAEECVASQFKEHTCKCGHAAREKPFLLFLGFR